MTIFGKFKDYLIRALTVTDDKAWEPALWRMIGSQSSAGENITEETSLHLSAVYNAVSLISGTVGSLPLHLMKKTGKGSKIADNKSIYNVMHTEWNPYMTAMAGRECLMSHVLSWGNGYAEKITNGLGEISALWPITPNRVRLAWENNELVYKITVGNETMTFPREKILHIPGLGFDGFQGYSVVAMARKSLGLTAAMETFGSLYFGQGTHPGVIVSHPGNLTATAHANLETSLATAHGGLGKSHRLMLLEEGMKIEAVGIPPEDSQFLQSRQFQIPEVARWFNLPPHKLKDLTKSSFSNIESEQISFVTDSILPWLVRLEQNYNMQLLMANESGRQKLYFKHVVEGLLRGDSASRGAFYTQMFNIGVMSINEIREKEDLNPIDDGDIHFVPMNMQTVEEAGKPKEEVQPVVPILPEETEEPEESNGEEPIPLPQPKQLGRRRRK